MGVTTKDIDLVAKIAMKLGVETPTTKDLEKLAVDLNGIILTPTIQTLGASRQEIVWWIKGLAENKWQLTQDSLHEAHAKWSK